MALDVLEARIGRIKHHATNKFNPSGMPFLIAQTNTGATVKGEMARPIEGESYRFWGEWKAQKGYPDPAFVFVSHEVIVDGSIGGIAQYLANHVPGLGPVKSAALVDAFGADTLTTLRAKPEMARQVPGITDQIVEKIRKHFEEDAPYDPVAFARLIDLFAGHKVPKKVVLKLLRNFGSSAPDMVLERPYQLLGYPRMGWKTVDAWALSTAKYDKDGIDRHKWAIVEALDRLALDGHTFATKADIDQIAFTMLDGCPRAEAWVAAEQEELIISSMDPEGQTFALPELDSAEREAAECLVRLADQAVPLGFTIDTDGLHEDQATAARVIENNGVSILTGAPGTGKSVTTSKVLASAQVHGITSMWTAAPTGKAAKRMAELLDKAGVNAPSTTIHRMLGPTPKDTEVGIPTVDAKIGRGREEFGFAKNAGNPIEAHHLFIDESSMLDIKLAASMLKAIKPGTRVVFVGDQNQLPSVGPGSFLRDMMEAGIPSFTLTKIVRSDGGGRVVRACHALLRGDVPAPAGRVELPTENWIHLEVDDPAQIAGKIVELHESVRKNGNSRFDPMWDMQVVSPQNRGKPIACDNLNRLLSDCLNQWKKRFQASSSNGDQATQVGGGAVDNADSADDFMPFAAGDKVVRTKNGLCDLMTQIPEADKETHVDWTWDDTRYTLSETDVVNGDMGEVIDIVHSSRESFVVVRFRTPLRYCRLPLDKCHLIAAYAMTAHKAQGSGFPYVIVPVHESFWWDAKSGNGLFSREWFYTAISRAEQLLVTVGQFSAVRKAVGRKTVHRRRTRLAQRIREARESMEQGEALLEACSVNDATVNGAAINNATVSTEATR